MKMISVSCVLLKIKCSKKVYNLKLLLNQLYYIIFEIMLDVGDIKIEP